MNFLKKHKAKIIVTSVIFAFLSFLAWETADAETTFDVGINFASTHYGYGQNLMLTERWNNKWVVGFGLVGDMQDQYGRNIKKNILVFGQRIVSAPGKFHNLSIGVGLAYFEHTTLINGSKLNFMLTIEYSKLRLGFWPDYYLIRHVSNAGVAHPNSGLNLLNFGYRFGK